MRRRSNEVVINAAIDGVGKMPIFVKEYWFIPGDSIEVTLENAVLEPDPYRKDLMWVKIPVEFGACQ